MTPSVHKNKRVLQALRIVASLFFFFSSEGWRRAFDGVLFSVFAEIQSHYSLFCSIIWIVSVFKFYSGNYIAVIHYSSSGQSLYIFLFICIFLLVGPVWGIVFSCPVKSRNKNKLQLVISFLFFWKVCLAITVNNYPLYFISLQHWRMVQLPKCRVAVTSAFRTQNQQWFGSGREECLPRRSW